MLRIDIPSTQVSQNTFADQSIPKPPNGTDTEVNGDVILLFEDEQEAVSYLDELEDFASSLDDDSPVRQTLNLIVSAIGNDEFVQAYLQ